MWSAIGELLFTVVVSYMGAIELLFVAKQLYHLAFQHQQREMLLSDDQSLKRLQDQIENEIAEASGKEIIGFNAMKDGVLYKDGFRIDPSEINDNDKFQRQVIGSSKTSLDRDDRETSANLVQKTESFSTESDVKEEVCEEPCVKKHVERVSSSREHLEDVKSADDHQSNISQSIKTQIGQTNVEDYSHSLSPRNKLEDSSLVETVPSQLIQTQPSQEFSPLIPELHFDEYEREEPDGQDVPEPQFSDEYLRSLDGIKIRPLVRDDGSGRRRAFKKRRSSDSTSSRESRASREEELKMFTSLEEEEFESIKRGDSNYAPIRYSSDPNLIKTGKHQRRHKKSPIKDSSHSETEECRNSLEMLDEENVSPWGDVKPEHYKDSEFWKREKAVSIEEESEENAQSWSDAVHKQQAGQAVASPSPTKNIPKFSSFEDATPSQHENVMPTLSQQKSLDKEKESTEKDVANVSNDDIFQPEQLIASHDQKNSVETEEKFACDNSDDQIEHKSLRRSPRLDDMNQYEEDLRKQENENVRALSPSSAQPPNNNDFSTSQLTTELQSEITQACSTDEQTISGITTKPDEISSTIGTECLREDSPRTFYKPETPVIEIEPAFDYGANKPEDNKNIKIISESGLLEGISDFYDFNASINPSRSPSVEKIERKSKSPSPYPSGFPKKQSKEPLEDMKPVPGLSDFYDFNVMMNQQAYGFDNTHDRKVHRSTTDYLAEGLKSKRSKSKSPAIAISLPKNDYACLPEESGGTKSVEDSPYPLDTPEYQRTFSANMRHVESVRDELRQNMYIRSRYVGESMDFENDFEELREQTRHFKRSQSKSRSPIPEDEKPSTSRQADVVAAKRELQDKILEEITRTTINYQDFSRNLNKPFMDFDRRVSDTALLQKPELMIQIEDACKERDFYESDGNDELEADEYHHFRRFSLNEHDQVDEYPDTNEAMYEEEIEAQTKTGIRSWTRRDYCDTDEKRNEEIGEESPSSRKVEITGEDSDHAEADEIDSESEDDRQTVVEVEDEIDEDVWDYERPEESNEQSECEEVEREMDRYANKNADDWNEDGAVGGIDHKLEVHNFQEDAIYIDEMYDDAVKNIEESTIEKDYDIIMKSVNDEENKKIENPEEINDCVSIKTEDLLDEILREDEARYKLRSPRRDKFEATANFIEHESTVGTSSQNRISPSAISSTRLRSRYGLAPSTAHRNFDNLENINVDLNYIPKKEYKWRKNFKLDEGDLANKSEDQNLSKLKPDEHEDDDNNGLSNGDLSKGSNEISESSENIASITFHTDEKEVDKIKETKDSTNNICEPTIEVIRETNIKNKEKKVFKSRTLVESMENNTKSDDETKEAELLPKLSQEKEKTLKKKKTKRRTRKGSKGSIGGDEEKRQNIEYDDIDEIDETEAQSETGAKKKIKKKKKSITSPDAQARSLSPVKTNTLNTKCLDTDEISKSQSPAKNLLISTSQKSTNEILSKNEETPKLSVYNEATSSQAKSKSKSPEVVKSTEPCGEPSRSDTSPKPKLERNDSTGVYELIKDGSMYPWF